jgi:hypothetical protein
MRANHILPLDKTLFQRALLENNNGPSLDADQERDAPVLSLQRHNLEVFLELESLAR